MVGTYLTNSPTDTQKLAAKVAQGITSGTVIALIGDLGTGKTAFTQGFAKAMGITEAVSSPTFKLISEYLGRENYLYHIDCYRFKNEQQFMNIGGEEYLNPIKGITVIEWADIIEEILPNNTVFINFKRIPGKLDYRKIIIN